MSLELRDRYYQKIEMVDFLDVKRCTDSNIPFESYFEIANYTDEKSSDMEDYIDQCLRGKVLSTNSNKEMFVQSKVICKNSKETYIAIFKKGEEKTFDSLVLMARADIKFGVVEYQLFNNAVVNCSDSLKLQLLELFEKTSRLSDIYKDTPLSKIFSDFDKKIFSENIISYDSYMNTAVYFLYKIFIALGSDIAKKTFYEEYISPLVLKGFISHDSNQAAIITMCFADESECAPIEILIPNTEMSKIFIRDEDQILTENLINDIEALLSYQKKSLPYTGIDVYDGQFDNLFEDQKFLEKYKISFLKSLKEFFKEIEKINMSADDIKSKLDEFNIQYVFTIYLLYMYIPYFMNNEDEEKQEKIKKLSGYIAIQLPAIIARFQGSNDVYKDTLDIHLNLLLRQYYISNNIFADVWDGDFSPNNNDVFLPINDFINHGSFEGKSFEYISELVYKTYDEFESYFSEHISELCGKKQKEYKKYFFMEEYGFLFVGNILQDFINYVAKTIGDSLSFEEKNTILSDLNNRKSAFILGNQ